jgi:diguanylate cyclase (GGDEF)-like protein
MSSNNIITVAPNVKRNVRLILGSSVLIGLIFIANAVVSAYLLRENTIKARISQLSNLTIVLAEHTSQTISSANAVLQSLVDIVHLSNIATEADFKKFAGDSRQFELLKEKTKSNSIIDVATFVGAQGEVLNFSRSFPPPKIDLSDRDYFRWLSVHNDATTFYSLPVQNKGNGKWVFYLARRVNGANNQFLGIILVGVSVEVFSSLYEKIGSSLGRGSSVILYRNDRRLLTRWPFVDDMIGKENNNGVMQQSLQSIQNGGVVMTGAPSFNMNNAPIERMVGFRRVENYPLIVGATASKELYLAGWHKSLVGVIYTTIFSLALLIAGTYIFLRAYQKNARTQYLAHHDSLTGLPNRLLFSDRLQQTINLAKRNHQKLAILFIDLDNLKIINDECGHLAGDALLVEVAERMRSCIRDSDTIGRVGGDEFIVLLPEVLSVDGAISVANKILATIQPPIEYEDKRLSTTASIGIAIYSDHASNEFDLINNADIAMYVAKSSGKNSIEVFGASVLERAVEGLY